MRPTASSPGPVWPRTWLPRSCSLHVCRPCPLSSRPRCLEGRAGSPFCCWLPPLWLSVDPDPLPYHTERPGLVVGSWGGRGEKSLERVGRHWTYGRGPGHHTTGGREEGRTGWQGQATCGELPGRGWEQDSWNIPPWSRHTGMSLLLQALRLCNMRSRFISQLRRPGLCASALS